MIPLTGYTDLSSIQALGRQIEEITALERSMAPLESKEQILWEAYSRGNSKEALDVDELLESYKSRASDGEGIRQILSYVWHPLTPR